MAKEEKVIIGGVEYVPASSAKMLTKAKSYKNMPYVIVRTYSAGVFAGYLAKRTGQEVTLKQARRIWYWDGAASLSELAVHGASKPAQCKFPVAVESIELLNAIEILECTEKAKVFIDSVPVWKFNE
jgi:hypothetical protein